MCEFKGTIRASTAAPLGSCTGVASSQGQHPYTCVACDALTHGKTSPLNRLLHRAPTLKHPRSDAMWATQPGINNKFVSAESLDIALRSRRVESGISKVKIDRLNQKLLSESWDNSPSIRPFVETLTSLIEQEKLSSFDISFLENLVAEEAERVLCSCR